jgi:hypothetical protein
MAILAALVALGSRFAGKILTTALGWASTMLFGRVPASRQYLLLGITFGSVIWVVLLIGVLLPDVGTFLLLFVPRQDFLPDSTIRLIMLVAALIVPAVIGGITLKLSGGGVGGARGVMTAIMRGYPLTALLAVLLVFLAVLAIARKVVSLSRGWTDAHVPLVVLPGRYDEVAADLDAAVTAAGLDVEPREAPGYLAMPARWLAAVAGTSAASLVPDRMIQLVGRDIDILIYSMDLLVSGKPGTVARARAAMASRLTTSAAHLTTSAEAQAIEDRLAALARPAEGDRPRAFDDVASSFEAIDKELATIRIPYDEWEVLYRQRLQVERDLRAGAMAGQAIVGAGTPGIPPSGVAEVLQELGRLIRTAADAAVDVAADERTGQVIDRMAGPQWRIAARVAAVAANAARSLVQAGRDGKNGSTGPGAPRAVKNVTPEPPATIGNAPGSPPRHPDPDTRSASRAS